MKLYDTLTRELQEITPLQEGHIKLYTCGLTVYSQPHIGNWVAYIYWDVLVRALKASGYDVTRVQNITDVGHLTSDEDAGEDKMLKGALKEGLTAWQVAEKYIAIADDEAYSQLGLIRPDHMPRATEYIKQQKAFVEELAAKGYTYVIEDGIYYDTSKFPNYGVLGQLDIEGLRFGARVADTGKKNPTDFAVWKFSPTDQKRDMEWDNPCGLPGKGFPGWHLECSVMARELLGDQIDIHTGGIDHIPVHHTNEIAQTEAVTGKPFSQYWVHANHIKVDGEKMSKSLGNIFTLQDITERGFAIDAFKLLVLGKHYRTEGNFTWEILEAAQNRLNNWRQATALLHQPEALPRTNKDISAPEFETALLAALNDDLDTAKALQVIDETMDKTLANDVCNAYLQDIVAQIHDTLGIDLTVSDISDEQKQLITERDQARSRKDWARSDELRDQLTAHGVGLRDTTNGALWYWL